MYFKAPLLDVESQRSSATNSHIFKVGIALIGGSCLVLLSVMGLMAMSGSGSTVHNPSAAESTSLLGGPITLRLKGQARPVQPMTAAQIRNLPALQTSPYVTPFKDLVLAAVEGSQTCDRDVSTNAMNLPGVKAVMAGMSSADRAMVIRAQAEATSKAETLLKSGVTQPLGYFDPAGFATMAGADSRLLFFREAEIKHARVCMLAFLGIAVGENFHPLFGGVDLGPAGKHFTLTGGDIFWVAAWAQFIFAAGVEEKRTFFPRLDGAAFGGFVPELSSSEVSFGIKGGNTPGDLGFDPLGWKPKTEKDLVTMQNKELNNGRMAMIAVVGALAQEMVTGEKIFAQR